MPNGSKLVSVSCRFVANVELKKSKTLELFMKRYAQKTRRQELTVSWRKIISEVL